MNTPSVTLTSVAPRSRWAITSIFTAIDVRPTFSISANTEIRSRRWIGWKNVIASIATVATGPSRAARRDDARGDIHLAQHPAAEDMAVGIDVGGRRHDAQNRHALEIGHGLSSLSLLRPVAWSSWPLDELRNASVINPVPSSTVSPTPSAVAIIM